VRYPLNMKPIFVTEIVRRGYDAQAADPTVQYWEPASWRRRIKNPFAVREPVRKNSAHLIDALTSLEAKAFECGVWLAYRTWGRPDETYWKDNKFFVTMPENNRLYVFKITVPRDPKERPTMED
jgi:hypothetical protein